MQGDIWRLNIPIVKSLHPRKILSDGAGKTFGSEPRGESPLARLLGFNTEPQVSLPALDYELGSLGTVSRYLSADYFHSTWLREMFSMRCRDDRPIPTTVPAA
jgi:hypothetical protein